MVGKFGTNVELGEGRHHWDDHTYQDVCAPPDDGDPCGHGRKIWGITVDGEPMCPAAPHPTVCQLVLAKVPVKGRVIDSDEHSLYGPKETLGLPVHNGEIVQLDGMACGVGMVIDGTTLTAFSTDYKPNWTFNSVSTTATLTHTRR